jgi:hypothetical protein
VRLTGLESRGEPEQVRDRAGLEAEHLGRVAPYPCRSARLVPHDQVRQRLGRPGDLDPLVASGVADERSARADIAHDVYTRAHLRELPAVAALAPALHQPDRGPLRRICRRLERAQLVVELGRTARRKLELDARLDQLEPQGQVLERDDRRAVGERGDDARDRERTAGGLDPSLRPEPVTLPAREAAGPIVLDQRPRVIGGLAVEPVMGAVDGAGATRVGQAALPAASPRRRPWPLVEVSGRRQLGPERRATQQLPAAAHVDQVEHLGPVTGIDARENLV